jgi:hypothetical protein
MTTQKQNTIPLRRTDSHIVVISSSIVLNGNHLCESVVNKPLSFLAHIYLRPIHAIFIQDKQNTFLYYVRIQVMSIVQNGNRTIRTEPKKKKNLRHIKYMFFPPSQ